MTHDNALCKLEYLIQPVLHAFGGKCSGLGDFLLMFCIYFYDMLPHNQYFIAQCQRSGCNTWLRLASFCTHQ